MAYIGDWASAGMAQRVRLAECHEEVDPGVEGGERRWKEVKVV